MRNEIHRNYRGVLRRSGDAGKPRILAAFNEKTLDWLSFYMFTFFTDCGEKYQLTSLAGSAFDPRVKSI